MMKNTSEQHDRGLYDFLASYIMDHPENFQHDKECCDCGAEQISNCMIPNPEDVELYDYDIRSISPRSIGLDTIILDILIKAHIDVYRLGKYQDEPEQITEWYHMEAYLDFGDFQIKCLAISICDEGEDEEYSM